MDCPMLDMNGKHAYKALLSRFPPVNHFRRIAAAHDFEMLDALEALTDDRARDEMGMIELVPQRERARLGQSDPAITAFTCFDKAGCTFSDGSYGVYYLQLEVDTAFLEAQQSLSAFLAASATAPLKHQLILYRCELSGKVADLRKCETVLWGQAGAESLAQARALERRLRAAGIAGALFPDARLAGANSVALFSTDALLRSTPQARADLHWDGSAMRLVARAALSAEA